jgi:YesN/AraC family two-component response regulator
MIKVALIDDQTLVRSGIVGLLNLTPDIRVVAQAADGLEAMVILEQMQFAVDVVLLDVRMPHCSGIELLRAHASVLPPTILLTTLNNWGQIKLK